MRQKKTGSWVATLSLALVTIGGAATAATDARYDDGPFCSKYFAEHGDASLAGDAHRRCMIAIASTYVDMEENSQPPEKILASDDISRHPLGTPPNFVAGSRAKLKGVAVIGAIKNRRWTVDGNIAWVVYDGYVKADPSKPGFFVAERFTIEKGLIREIMLPKPFVVSAQPEK